MRIPTPNTPTTRREINEQWDVLEAVKIAITAMADGYDSARYSTRRAADSAACTLESYGWKTSVAYLGERNILSWTVVVAPDVATAHAPGDGPERQD
jgi:hypothetical protein